LRVCTGWRPPRRLAPQGSRVGQGGNQVKSALELLCGFGQRRALQRPLTRFTPQACGLLDHASLSAVTCQKLRWAFGHFREFTLKGFCYAGGQGGRRALRTALHVRVS
jgi:hypothetical protein